MLFSLIYALNKTGVVTYDFEPEIKETIDILETLNIEEVLADEESILQKMRLYHAL